MSYKSFIVLILLMWRFSYSQTTHYFNYVNPFIGTGGAGHTFPGAVVPFGMVQLSPDTRIDGSWEGCSGYHYSDSIIYGFSHTHLNGTGVGDYGDILIMPTTQKINDLKKNYESKFSHLKEKASAGFYQVQLENSVEVRLTVTPRVGIHEYTFSKTDTGSIYINLFHRDKTTNSTLKIIDSVTICGSRISEGWAQEQHVYFYIKFSKPFLTKTLRTIAAENLLPNQEEMTQAGFFQFDVQDGKPIMLKVGISQTNIEGAKKNLEAEAKHWDFETYKLSAEKIWENELAKIEVTTNDDDKLVVFYTALYHCMIHPSLAGDVDGKYRGRDFKIHQANGFTPYTVF